MSEKHITMTKEDLTFALMKTLLKIMKYPSDLYHVPSKDSYVNAVKDNKKNILII